MRRYGSSLILAFTSLSIKRATSPRYVCMGHVAVGCVLAKIRAEPGYDKLPQKLLYTKIPESAKRT